MTSIFIADDHNLIREGLKRLIEAETDLRVVGEAANAAEVFSFFKHNTCDLIILDINLPDHSGLDVLKDLKAVLPHLKALILSMYPEDRFAFRALKAGANGYITKESANTEMIKAIRKVLDGRKYISENLVEQLAYSFGNNPNKKEFEKLSDREFQVLLQIGSGKSVNEIASNLNLSASTVNTYRNRVLEKMGMKTNLELIYYCVKSGLVD